MLLWDRKPVAFPHWCVWPPTTSLVPVLESPRGFPLWHDWETAPSSAITNGQIIRDNEQSCHHHTAFLEPNHPLTISMLIFPTPRTISTPHPPTPVLHSSQRALTVKWDEVWEFSHQIQLLFSSSFKAWNRFGGVSGKQNRCLLPAGCWSSNWQGLW